MCNFFGDLLIDIHSIVKPDYGVTFCVAEDASQSASHDTCFRGFAREVQFVGISDAAGSPASNQAVVPHVIDDLVFDELVESVDFEVEVMAYFRVEIAPDLCADTIGSRCNDSL